MPPRHLDVLTNAIMEDWTVKIDNIWSVLIYFDIFYNIYGPVNVPPIGVFSSSKLANSDYKQTKASVRGTM